MADILWWVRAALSLVALYSLFTHARSTRRERSLDDDAAQEALASLDGLVETDRGRSCQTSRVDQRGELDLLWSCGATPESFDGVELIVRVGARDAFDVQVGPPGVMGRDAFPRLILERLSPIMIRPRTSMDTLGLTMGLQRVHRTQDPEFDEGTYIETTAPKELVEALLEAPEVRRGVLDLLSQGFAAVAFYAPEAQLVAVMNDPTKENLAGIPRAGDSLTKIAREMPHLELPEPIPYSIGAGVGGLVFSNWHGSTVVLTIASLIVYALASWLLFDDVTDQTLTPTLQASLMTASFVAFAAMMVTIIARARRTTTGLRAVATWNLGATCVLLWVVPGVFVMSNSLLDSSPEQTTTVRLGEVSCGAVYTADRCFAEVEPIDELPELRHLRISAHMKRTLAALPLEQRRMELRYGTGALGYPVLRELELVD